MNVAIITAYHEITPELKLCLESAAKQSYEDITHITVGDGCNLPADWAFDTLNIPLPKNINDYGDSPRAIGVVYAKSMGADAIAFLDSDNWFAPNHIELMVNTAIQNGSEVVACKRQICHLDGSVMGLCLDNDGKMFCDTNCMLVTKNLFDALSSGWLMPDHLHVIGDRIIWDRLIHATEKISILNMASVYYRSAFAGHYSMFNQVQPKGVKSGNKILRQTHLIEQLAERALLRMQTLSS